MMKTQETMAKNSLKKIAVIGTTLAVLGTSMAGCRSTPRSRAFGDFVTREMVKSAIHRDSNTTNVNVYNERNPRQNSKDFILYVISEDKWRLCIDKESKCYPLHRSNGRFFRKDKEGRYLEVPKLKVITMDKLKYETIGN